VDAVAAADKVALEAAAADLNAVAVSAVAAEDRIFDQMEPAVAPCVGEGRWLDDPTDSVLTLRVM
jgi:hypothetical protein